MHITGARLSSHVVAVAVMVFAGGILTLFSANVFVDFFNGFGCFFLSSFYPSYVCMVKGVEGTGTINELFLIIHDIKK